MSSLLRSQTQYKMWAVLLDASAYGRPLERDLLDFPNCLVCHSGQHLRWRIQRHCPFQVNVKPLQVLPLNFCIRLFETSLFKSLHRFYIKFDVETGHRPRCGLEEFLNIFFAKKRLKKVNSAYRNSESNATVH